MAERLGKYRIALAVLTLALGAAALAHTAGMVFAERAPAFALRFAPYNSAALAKHAIDGLEADPSAGGQRLALERARRALRRNATEAPALGVVALAQSDPLAARRAAVASQTLSRRALRTQLWFIEDSVSRGDVKAALVHYDTALRTSLAAPSILFPILVEAVGDPALVRPIADLLSKRPAWGGLYLQQLAQSGTAYPGIARLFELLIRRGVEPGEDATNSLYARLIAARAYDPAWQVFAARYPAARRPGLRNGDFRTQGASPAPFEWQSTDNAALAVTMDRSGLSFDATGGEGGEVVNQLMLLGPGKHRLSVVAGPIDAPADSLPYWSVTCLNGPELARLKLPATQSPRTLALDVPVPSGCPVQRIVLVSIPSISNGRVEGAIRRVMID